MDIAYTFLAEAGNLISNMSCWPRPPNNYSIFVVSLPHTNKQTNSDPMKHNNDTYKYVVSSTNFVQYRSLTT